MHITCAMEPDGSYSVYLNGELRAKYATPELMHVHAAAMLQELEIIHEYETKYHRLISNLKRVNGSHGDCESGKRYNGKPLDCAACMAKLEIEEELASYKNLRIGLDK